MGLEGSASVRKEQDATGNSGGDVGSGEEREKAEGGNQVPKAVLGTL